MATTIPESHHDLLDAPVATLATIGPDGRPQQTVIWFLAEGDTIRISLNTDRQKVKNLRSNPHVDLLVVDPANTQRYLEVRGDAEIADDADYAFATKVGAKYGADLRAYDAPGSARVVVTIQPARVNAVDLSAG
jgi:PPOX class probable F420-dependent enzyme